MSKSAKLKPLRKSVKLFKTHNKHLRTINHFSQFKKCRSLYRNVGRRGIARTRNFTHLLKNVLNLFVCIKHYFFFLQFSFLYLIYSRNGGYNINKNPPPATTNPILRKWVQFRVGAIPSEPEMLLQQTIIKGCVPLRKVQKDLSDQQT